MTNNKKYNYKYFFTAIVFLLLIQLKPIHSFSHLLDSTHSTPLELTDNNETFSEIDFCEICDYNFSPTLEVSSYENLKVVFTEFHTQLFNSKTNSFYSNSHSKNKQLRAPPLRV